MLAKDSDPVHFGAAHLCRWIHALGLREPLPVSLCPFGIAGNRAAWIRVNTGGLFAAGCWNRRNQHQEIPPPGLNQFSSATERHGRAYWDWLRTQPVNR